jgi:hypothetical protein
MRFLKNAFFANTTYSVYIHAISLIQHEYKYNIKSCLPPKTSFLKNELPTENAKLPNYPRDGDATSNYPRAGQGTRQGR